MVMVTPNEIKVNPYYRRKLPGKLLQIVRTNTFGKTVRVTEYQIKNGFQIVVSETIRYKDGSSTLHFYNADGDVIEIIKYNKNGVQTSATKINTVLAAPGAISAKHSPSRTFSFLI